MHIKQLCGYCKQLPQYARHFSNKPVLKQLTPVNRTKAPVATPTNYGNLAKIIKERACSSTKQLYEPQIVGNGSVLCTVKNPHSTRSTEESSKTKQYRLLAALKDKLNEENALRQEEIKQQRVAISENLKLCSEIEGKLLKILKV